VGFGIGERDRRGCGWFVMLETVLVSTIDASSNTFYSTLFACASADNAVLVYTLENVRFAIIGCSLG
jgi:hypothetical protein